MLVKLSAKGQIALPKSLRKDLRIGPGAVLKIERHGRQIILEPVPSSLIDRLYGKYAGESLLQELEADHRRELGRENRS